MSSTLVIVGLGVVVAFLLVRYYPDTMARLLRRLRLLKEGVLVALSVAAILWGLYTGIFTFEVFAFIGIVLFASWVLIDNPIEELKSWFSN